MAPSPLEAATRCLALRPLLSDKPGHQNGALIAASRARQEGCMIEALRMYGRVERGSVETT